jgi:hypothetical protein
MDDLLDDLLTERHPHTVSQSNGNYGEYEEDKAYIKLSKLRSRRQRYFLSGTSTRLRHTRSMCIS